MEATKDAPASVAGGMRKVSIHPPNFKTLTLHLEGTTPLGVNRWSNKAKDVMRKTQEAGSVATKAKRGGKRAPRNFRADFEAAQYRGPHGERGVSALGFKNALVIICAKLFDWDIVLAKMCLWIEPDCYDFIDGTPLIVVRGKGPKMDVRAGRNADLRGTMNLRARPVWAPGWKATVRVSFDADRFKEEEVVNAMARVGMQNGVGEGRMNSRRSCGIGWGAFKLVGGRSDGKKGTRKRAKKEANDEGAQ